MRVSVYSIAAFSAGSMTGNFGHRSNFEHNAHTATRAVKTQAIPFEEKNALKTHDFENGFGPASGCHGPGREDRIWFLQLTCGALFRTRPGMTAQDLGTARQLWPENARDPI
jgi:hypothetical protein